MKREILDHLPESLPGSDDEAEKSDAAAEVCDKKDEDDADGDKEMMLEELKEVNGKDPVQHKDKNGELANGHHNGTVAEDADMKERNENEAPKTNEGA